MQPCDFITPGSDVAVASLTRVLKFCADVAHVSVLLWCDRYMRTQSQGRCGLYPSNQSWSDPTTHMNTASAKYHKIVQLKARVPGGVHTFRSNCILCCNLRFAKSILTGKCEFTPKLALCCRFWVTKQADLDHGQCSFVTWKKHDRRGLKADICGQICN